MITLGLGTGLLITLGFSASMHAAGLPPAVICLADTAQSITLADASSGSITLADSVLECL